MIGCVSIHSVLLHNSPMIFKKFLKNDWTPFLILIGVIDISLPLRYFLFAQKVRLFFLFPNIEGALHQANWKIFRPDDTTKLLGIKPTTLLFRIKKMWIPKPT